MGTHQKIAAIVFALAASAVLGFLSMSPPEFMGARISLAVAAISLLLLYLLWVFASPDEMVGAKLAYGAIVAVILVFGMVYGSRYIDYRQQLFPTTPLYAGLLTPSPKILFSGARLENDMPIQIGRSGVFLSINNQFGQKILPVLKETQFKVESVSGVPPVSTDITDINGKLIAEIRRNEWKVLLPAAWDRNYSNDAVEVKDDRVRHPLAQAPKTAYRPDMMIRREEPSDISAIRAVVMSAFKDAPHSSGTEAAIVDRLRESGALTISLIAEDEGEVVGHVAFSSVKINAETVEWYGLGPVAVRPDKQRRGIGRALIEAGLDCIRSLGARGCVVLGDPAYYRRFGFKSDPALRLAHIRTEYFQQLSLGDEKRRGVVEYDLAFFAS